MEVETLDTGEQDEDSAIIDIGAEKETESEEDSQTDAEGTEEQEEAEEAVGDSSDGDEEDPQEIIAKLKAEKEKAEKDRDRAFYNLRNAKKSEKKESKEPEFTDAQLLDLIETHREDPAVMLQIMKQVSKQQSGEMADTKIKSQELKAKKQQIDGFLTQNYGPYMDDGNPVSQELKKAKEFFHINDHPLGDYLAVAAMELANLPVTVEAVKKQAVEEALKKNGETSRKKAIKESSTGTSKPKSKVEPSPDNDNESRWLANAKQFNFDKKQTESYIKMMKSAAAKKRSLQIKE